MVIIYHVYHIILYIQSYIIYQMYINIYMYRMTNYYSLNNLLSVLIFTISLIIIER